MIVKVSLEDEDDQEPVGCDHTQGIVHLKEQNKGYYDCVRDFTTQVKDWEESVDQFEIDVLELIAFTFQQSASYKRINDQSFFN